MSLQALFSPQELRSALERAVKQARKRRFTQSVEMIVVLQGVDMKKPENRINVTVALPRPPPSKPAKVVVIATGDLALKAREAGADLVLDRESLEKIASDKRGARKLAKKYDFFLAQPDLMVVVGRVLGKYLGPRGKMPQPVPPNAPIALLIERLKGSVRLRSKDQPQIACVIGTEDQPIEHLLENAQAVLEEILKKFPPHNIRRIYFKLTMGEPVTLSRRVATI
uniref:Large ribosomal subunit protein uL1 n=1 Tax=Thermofilum pendens TaxID=2269 RepID=A0A7C3WK60_THEPE